MSKHQHQQPKVVHRPAQQQGQVSPEVSTKQETSPDGPRTVRAHAFIRVPGKGWVAIDYLIQGDKVIKIEASKPDLKPIAQENFRRKVATTLLGEDE